MLTASAFVKFVNGQWRIMTSFGIDIRQSITKNLS